MLELDDHDLLAQYARENSQAAFETLTNRYLNLVYSTAHRTCGNPSAAEEISQAVFILLAKKSGTLSPRVVLAGWLYQTTRLTAANYLRGEMRRIKREQEAVMQSPANDAETWRQIAPLLDDAMGHLGEKDRSAVVLRYFENKSLSEVGLALGTSEDAAKMRVNRALEKLRKLFGQRGVTLTGTAIAGAVSVNSVHAAPASLAAIISAGVLSSSSTVATSGLLASTKIVAMSSLQKISISTLFLATVGVGVFEAHQNAQLRTRTDALVQEQTTLAQQIQQWQSTYAQETNRLALVLLDNQHLREHEPELLRLRAEVTRLQNQLQHAAQSNPQNATDPATSQEAELLRKVKWLKQRVSQLPAAETSCVKYLKNEDWMFAAGGSKLETEDDYRNAIADVLSRANGAFLLTMETALQKYLSAHGNQFPGNVSDLKSYFDTPPEDDLLQRYAVVPATNLPSANLGEPTDWLITLKSPVGASVTTLGRNGVGGYANSSDMEILAPALKALFDASPTVNGGKHVDIHDLGPYLTTPEQRAAYQRLTIPATDQNSP